MFFSSVVVVACSEKMHLCVTLIIFFCSNDGRSQRLRSGMETSASSVTCDFSPKGETVTTASSQQET